MARRFSARGAALLALAIVVYGKHLADGHLADDFAYLASLREGFDVLMRKVTVDSHPQTLRPLPALAWYLTPLPAGTVLHHGLSILLHGLAGWLVCRIATRTSRSRTAGLLLGALFVAFPLFAEPVIWLSAQPDLWACVTGLGALCLATASARSQGADAGATRPAPVAVVGCFAVSLMCKESALLLPALLFFFLPARRCRRLAAILGALALLYLGLRFLLFGGLGGYLDSTGQSVIRHFDPDEFLHQLRRLPSIVAGHPLTRAGDLEVPLAVTSCVLLVGLVLGGRLWRRWRSSLAMAGVFAVALLPVAPIYFIGNDHEGSRMLYFPVAAALAAGGGLLRRAPAAARYWSVAILVFWSLIAAANGRPWSEASRELGETVEQMAELGDRLPKQAVVLVAGHDTWHGAYTWRNAMRWIVKLRYLRPDVDWRVGTAALIARPQRLRRHIFEIGYSEDRVVDWTPCQAALHGSRTRPLARHELRWPQPSDAAVRDLESLRLKHSGRWVGVRIVAARAVERNLRGRLFWRGETTGDYSLGDSRMFQIFAGKKAQSSIVRLPPMAEPPETLDLRIALFDAGDFASLGRVEILKGPRLCQGRPIRGKTIPRKRPPETTARGRAGPPGKGSRR